MRIEVWEGAPSDGRRGWYWHFKARNGKITADSECFPSKSNAMRAAKSVVREVIIGREYRPDPDFVAAVDPNYPGITRITW